MSAEYVLDTLAIFAHFRREPGGERVRDLLRQAERAQVTLRMSAISVGEVLYQVEREAGRASVNEFLATLRSLPIVIIDVIWERILAAAHVKATFPVSYADAFAIALAHEFGATVVTGDPEFRSVANLVTVEWLQQR